MNAPVTAPAFADKLPPKGPTLDELAWNVICAADHRDRCPDADWNEADTRVVDAQAKFRAEFFALTNLTPRRLRQLLDKGLL